MFSVEKSSQISKRKMVIKLRIQSDIPLFGRIKVEISWLLEYELVHATHNVISRKKEIWIEWFMWNVNASKNDIKWQCFEATSSDSLNWWENWENLHCKWINQWHAIFFVLCLYSIQKSARQKMMKISDMKMFQTSFSFIFTFHLRELQNCLCNYLPANCSLVSLHFFAALKFQYGYLIFSMWIRKLHTQKRQKRKKKHFTVIISLKFTSRWIALDSFRLLHCDCGLQLFVYTFMDFNILKKKHTFKIKQPLFKKEKQKSAFVLSMIFIIFDSVWFFFCFISIIRT